jgi:hypothetical protein
MIYRGDVGGDWVKRPSNLSILNIYFLCNKCVIHICTLEEIPMSYNVGGNTSRMKGIYHYFCILFLSHIIETSSHNYQCSRTVINIFFTKLPSHCYKPRPGTTNRAIMTISNLIILQNNVW